MRAFRLLKTSLQQLDAELTSRSLTLDGTLGGLNMSGTINAAGSTGDAAWSANTAAARSTNNPLGPAAEPTRGTPGNAACRSQKRSET